MNATDVAVAIARLHPPAPETLEESGLTRDLLMQIALKTLYFAGELSGAELARRMGVKFRVIEPALDFLKERQHCGVVGGAMLGGAAFRFRITDAGRTAAALYLQQNQYVGVAPVPLKKYRDYMVRYRAIVRPKITRERVREAFSHLVLNDRVLDELGPAITGSHSIFVYGAPGNGKTVIAQSIRYLLEGDLAIPHAVEVDGAVIRMFDPGTHESLPGPEEADGLESTFAEDRRWVRCKRPMVTVGGELTLDLLELNYSAASGFYRAPIQVIANGGVLIIDDFGRERISPQDLLNRWMVPLESGVDFLTLNSGLKVEIPFMALVVFATNLRPSELVDEAFMRRVQFKVFAESPTRDQFRQIFENYCRARDIAFDPAHVAYILDGYYKHHQISLRGCQPRDLINQALLLAAYYNRPPALTPDLLDEACQSYFVEEGIPTSAAR